MTTFIRGLLPAHPYFPPQQTFSVAGARSSGLRRIIATCSLVMLCSLTLAQANRESTGGSPEATESIAIENPGVAVEIDGRPVLVVYAQIAGFTSQERAEAIQERIVALAKRRDIAVEAIHAEDRGTWTEILAGTERIMGITALDAKGAERSQPELAAEYTEVIRQVVKEYRADHAWRKVLWGALYAILATAGFAGFLALLFVIGHRARSRVEKWLGQFDAGAQAQSPRMGLIRYLGRPLLALSRATFWLVVLALVQAYGTLVLRFFPSTKYTSYQITNWLVSELAGCV